MRQRPIGVQYGPFLSPQPIAPVTLFIGRVLRWAFLHDAQADEGQDKAEIYESADRASTGGFGRSSGALGELSSKACRLSFVPLGRCSDLGAQMVIEQA